MPVANTLPNGVVESSNSDPASLGGFAYASSVRQTYKVADQAALNLLADMETGDLAFRQDDGSYLYYNGTTWNLWYTTRSVNFTPIWVNLTAGNGTLNYARYAVVGGTYRVDVSFTLGSTSSVTGRIGFAYPAGLPLPVLNDQQVIGNGWAYDASALRRYPAWSAHRTSGQITTDILDPGVSGSVFPYLTPTSNSVPFTWAASDAISIEATWTV